MTAPNVGKVTLGVDVNANSLLDGLTKSVRDEVVPLLNDFNEVIKESNKEIDKINAKPLAEIAKEARRSQEETKKVTDQVARLRRERFLLTKNENALADATNRRRIAEQKLAKEITDTGKATDQRIAAAERAASREAEAHEALQLRMASVKRMEQDLKNFRVQQAEDWRTEMSRMYREDVAEAEAASDDIIKDAQKRSRELIDEEQRVLREREKAAKDAADAAIKESKRAADEQRKIENKKRREEQRSEDRIKRTVGSQFRDVGAVVGLGRVNPSTLAVVGAIVGELAAMAAALSQSLLIVPAGLAAIGTAAGTAKVALMGVGDAMDALGSYADDPEKYAEALEKLAPAAQGFMEALRAVMPMFKELQTTVQENFFDGFGDTVKDLTRTYFPELKESMGQIATEFNGWVKAFATELMTPDMQANIGVFFDNLIEAMHNLTPAMPALAQALGDLIAVGSDFLPDIGRGLADAAGEFADWMREAKDSGELKEWIQNGLDALGDLKDLLFALTRIFLSTSEHGETSLGRIADAAVILADTVDWVKSVVDSLKQSLDGIANSWYGKLIGKVFDGMSYLMPGGSSILGAPSIMPDNASIRSPQRDTSSGRSSRQKPWEQQPSGLLGTLFPGIDIPKPDAPVTIPTPSNPADDAAALERQKELEKGPSDADLRKAIEAATPFVEIDPFAPIGGINQQPGWPGQRPLDVTVDNMPDTGMFPGVGGLAGIPNMFPGGAAPTVLGGQDAGSIASYIANKAMSEGYSAQEAVAFVAQALGESGLDPAAFGASTGDSSGGASGIFQFTPQTWADFGMGGNPLSAKENIDAYFRLAQARDPRTGDIRSRLAQISGGGPAWEGTPSVPWSEYLQRATNLIGPLTGPAALPSLPSMPYPPSAPPMSSAVPPMNMSAIPQIAGTNSAISALGAIAKSVFGLDLTSGKRDWAGTASGTSFHLDGQAGDFAIPGVNVNDPRKAQFAAWLNQNFGQYLQELIYSDPSVPGVSLNSGAPFNYGAGTNAEHENHVHVAIRDEMQQAFLAALTGVKTAVGSPWSGGNVPLGLGDNMYAANGPMQVDPLTGKMGYFQTDTQAIWEAENRVKEVAHDLSVAMHEENVKRQEVAAGLATEMDLYEAHNRVLEKTTDLQAAQMNLEEKKRGSFKSAPKAAPFDIKNLPYGSPERIMAGVLGGLGVSGDEIGQIIGGAISPLGAPLGGALGGAAGSAFSVPLPGPMGYTGTPTAPASSVGGLIGEQNPMALFQAAGINVPDFTRQGGGAGAQNLTVQGGPASDAMGRIYSDTAALVDRTFTNLDAAEKARHDQVMMVLNEVRDRLAKDYVGPVTEAAVTGGIDGLGSGTAQAIGTAMGQAAGPAIAAAIPQGGSGSSGIGADMVNLGAQTFTQAGQAAAGFAGGGGITGPGTGTSDSILARVSNGEWVMTAGQVRAMGGFAGMRSFVDGLPKFATGGGVDVSAQVGAEFFGVGQVPIIAAVVNLLVAVLLRIIGVTVEARDTLNEISSEFREFRGDFQAFDAAGRLMNDTSGLVDRSGSDTQTAADERIRILKQVLEGLFKWLIEKIIVPISKAVANTAINIGAQAVNGAITGGMGAAFPGGSVVGGMVGGLASSAISSAGQASVDIIADVGTILAESIISVGLDAIGGLLQSYLPDFTNALFGGGLLSAIIDPVTGALNGILSGVTTLFGGLAGGLATLIPGIPFDNGGVATGMGLMPKATIAPERVLSPQQTASFDRLVDALTSGKIGAAGSTTTINAPFTVTGGERGGREVRDRLLALMG